MEDTKRCKACFKDLPISCFALTANKDNTVFYPRNTCKECRAEQRRQRERIPENHQRKAAYKLNYSRTHRDKTQAWHKTWRGKNRERQMAKKKVYYQSNRLRIIHQIQTYRRENHEIIRFRARVRYLRDREKIALSDARYRSTPSVKARRRANDNRREALKRASIGTFTQQQFYSRCEYYGWRCYLCGIPVTKRTVSIEHRIPITRGGTNWPANLAPACRSCNSRKHTKTEPEYRAHLARYKQFLA